MVAPVIWRGGGGGGGGGRGASGSRDARRGGTALDAGKEEDSDKDSDKDSDDDDVTIVTPAAAHDGGGSGLESHIEVGTRGKRSPRHSSPFSPSFIELNDILCRGWHRRIPRHVM